MPEATCNILRGAGREARAVEQLGLESAIRLDNLGHGGLRLFASGLRIVVVVGRHRNGNRDIHRNSDGDRLSGSRHGEGNGRGARGGRDRREGRGARGGRRDRQRDLKVNQAEHRGQLGICEYLFDAACLVVVSCAVAHAHFHVLRRVGDGIVVLLLLVLIDLAPGLADGLVDGESKEKNGCREDGQSQDQRGKLAKRLAILKGRREPRLVSGPHDEDGYETKNVNREKNERSELHFF